MTSTGTQRAIGIDVGGTKIAGIAIDPADPLDPIAQARVPTPSGAGPVAEAIVGVIRDLSAAAGPPAGIGVGVPGLVDRDGVFRYGPNLAGVGGLDIRSELTSAFGVPIDVENDATAAAWGEFAVGAASDVDDMLLLTLGTGIGAGVVTGGQLLRGANGFAGEAGHMVLDPSGPACTCGRRGCFEVYASGRGLGYLARRAAFEGRADRLLQLVDGSLGAITGEHVTIALTEGDTGAMQIMAEFATWLALGVSNCVNLLDPDVVVLGGGVVGMGDQLLEPARRAYREMPMGAGHRPEVELRSATLGPEAGAIGAALLGWAAGSPAPTDPVAGPHAG